MTLIKKERILLARPLTSMDTVQFRMKVHNGNHNWNQADNDMSTPLHEAAARGNTLICQLLINSIENKNPRDFVGKTPLHKAAKNGHLNICKLITGHVEDKNPEDNNGVTPIGIAINATVISRWKIRPFFIWTIFQL